MCAMGIEPSEGQTGVGRQIGRYVLFDEIAAGGMATVHLGRLVGAIGFSRTVAIKRLHPQFAKDADFVAMFMDEARLCARIRHPNVVPTLDVVSTQGELFLVLEYVQGDSLSRLIRKCTEQGNLPPPAIVAWVISGVLHGLHAAHEARNEQGEQLHIVHRDVSPQNVLIGVDGIPRILDFGVAHAQHRAQTTRGNQVKGKIAYMAPEQLQRDEIDRRSDIYAAGVVLWEALTGQRLFQGQNEGRIVAKILEGAIQPPSIVNPSLGRSFDAIVLKALAKNPDDRFQTARDFAMTIERKVKSATSTTTGAWVEGLASDILTSRADRIAEIESRSDVFAAMKSQGTPFAPWTPQALPPQSGPQATMPDMPMTPIQPMAPASQPSVPQPPVSSPSAAHSQPIVPVPSESTNHSLEPLPVQLRPSKAQVFAILGGLVLMLGLAITLFVVASSKDDKPPIAPAAVPPATTTTASTIATSTAQPPVTATAQPTTSAAPTVSASASAKKKPPVVFVKPPSGGCNPPYTVDAQGVKHPKPECL